MLPTKLFPALDICIYSIFPVDPFIGWSDASILAINIPLAPKHKFNLPGRLPVLLI